jgi:predicted signal transduction protein with EAL and GGDEF domain
MQGDLTLRHKDGKLNYLTYSMLNQLAEPSIQGIVINWRDITDRIESLKEIEYLATHDELTTLPNRVSLKQKMSQLCSQKGKSSDSFSLIMLDIDGFRYVNDALGYQLGDQLIVQVASRLKNFKGGSISLSLYRRPVCNHYTEFESSWEYDQAGHKNHSPVQGTVQG